MLTAESRDFLNLLPLQAEEAAPQDDSFEGHPGGASRGLAFAITIAPAALIFLALLLWADLR